MKFRRIFHIVIAVAVTAVAVIVLMYRWHASVTRELMLKQRSCDEMIRSRDMTIKDMENQISRFKDAVSVKNENLPSDLLIIYSYNAHVDIGTIGFGVVVPDNYTLF
ncbi:MAG: hypothetical protein JSW02_03950, partial [candidate division WOR-3 bacterium]